MALIQSIPCINCSRHLGPTVFVDGPKRGETVNDNVQTLDCYYYDEGGGRRGIEAPVEIITTERNMVITCLAEGCISRKER